MSNELPPAGWYADPEGSGGQRFWDGEAWTSAAMSPDGRPVASGDRTAAVEPEPAGPVDPGLAAAVGPEPTAAVVEPHPVPVEPVAPMAAPSPPAPMAAPATPAGPGPAGSWSGQAEPFLPSNQPHPASSVWPPHAAGGAATRTATTANLGDRLRALPRGAWVGVAVVVLLVVVVAGRGAATYDVEGTFDLVDSHYLSVADGARCQGHGGYGDIDSGLQVTVKDATGRLIASSALRTGRVEGSACVFPFQITEITRSDYYTFEVGRRGDLTYSHAEMVANGWEAGFVLGDR